MSSKPEATLLMTCVGGELAPQALQYMRNSTRYRIRTVGVDASPSAVGRHFCDAFHVVPRGTEAGYVDAVRAVAEREGVQIVLPSSDEEAIALSAGRAALEKGGRLLACTDAATIRVFSSKAATHAAIARAGLAVPEWTEVTTLAQLTVAVDKMLQARGEAVVKPSGGRGGRGAVVIQKDIEGVAPPLPGAREIHCGVTYYREHLLAHSESSLPAIVMQRLEEPVHDIDMLGWHGQPVRVVARRRLNSQQPNEGHTVVNSPALLQLGRSLIEHFNLSWLYDCDVMFDAAGMPYVVEINPRPSGSVTVTICAGVPLYDDIVALARGEAVAEVPFPAGRTVVPYRALQPSSR